MKITYRLPTVQELYFATSPQIQDAPEIVKAPEGISTSQVAGKTTAVIPLSKVVEKSNFVDDWGVILLLTGLLVIGRGIYVWRDRSKTRKVEELRLQAAMQKKEQDKKEQAQAGTQGLTSIYGSTNAIVKFKEK